MIAVVPVRGGVLPLGGDEAVAEAGGRALVVGDGAADAAAALAVDTVDVRVAEAGAFAPAAWSAALAPLLDDEQVVLLPASPDGRDLAPRLSHVLDRPLLAGAVAVGTAHVVVARRGGFVQEEHALTGPVVATLQPGVRGIDVAHRPSHAEPVTLDLDLGAAAGAADAEVVEVTPPDPATMDLAEAPRIVAGGAGLGETDFPVLERVAAALGASLGATRVVTDYGWVPFERQIGTTGVTVRPRLYLALGISGAVQHVTGLGDPEHIVSVNLDASCPMMTMADLAIVADGPAVVAALAERLHAREAAS